MADNDTQVPAEDGSAPAESPALTSEQIQAIVAEGLKAEFDKRIPGLQSAYERQLSQLRNDFDGLRRSSMTDEEIETEEESTLAAERDAAVARAAALEAARKYPRGFEIYDQIMAAETAEDQIAILEQFVQASASPEEEGAPAEGEAEGEAGTPDIDPNNPARENAGGRTPWGSSLQGALDYINKNASHWRQ